MSSYYRIILILFLNFNFLFGSTISKYSSTNTNDSLILMALDYELHQEINKSMKIYTKLYKKTRGYEYLQKAISQSLITQDFRNLLVLCKGQNCDTIFKLYLKEENIYSMISILEKEEIDNARLLLLYEQTGQFKKALQLVRKKYLKTKDQKLLAQIAILRFEMAKDKRKVMKHIIANFELALKVTNNPQYKNYYGYLLIDYDLNVKKGLKLVKEALKVSPTNMAYIDSVAWGYYKLGKYKKALSYMKKIITPTTLNDKEIKRHWDKIKQFR